MNGVHTLSSAPRSVSRDGDSQAWRATLAAAQRVLGYYASKAEGSAAMRREDDDASAIWNDELEPAPRLAA